MQGSYGAPDVLNEPLGVYSPQPNVYSPQPAVVYNATRDSFKNTSWQNSGPTSPGPPAWADGWPYRGSIREASSLLVRKLARRPQGVKPRDWDGVEIRIHSLLRLERVRGKTGGSSTASATPSTMGGSDDIEPRLFCETLRDGYVLCM